MDSEILQIAKVLSTAKHVVVLTGAGISAESGVATFRDKDGLWSKFRPEELANFNSFIQNPKLVTEWYQARRDIVNNVEPNHGHYAIAELETLVPQFNLVTQNVDGLHHRAGSKNIIELHGNINRNYCINCRKRYDNATFDSFPPVCDCSPDAFIRPDVVWFGEMLPEVSIRQAFAFSRLCNVFLSIGTSAVVYPAAHLPIEAMTYGAYVIEINLEPTPLSSNVNISLRGKSGELLPQIIQGVKDLREQK